MRSAIIPHALPEQVSILIAYVIKYFQNSTTQCAYVMRFSMHKNTRHYIAIHCLTLVWRRLSRLSFYFRLSFYLGPAQSFQKQLLMAALKSSPSPSTVILFRKEISSILETLFSLAIVLTSHWQLTAFEVF